MERRHLKVDPWGAQLKTLGGSRGANEEDGSGGGCDSSENQNRSKLKEENQLDIFTTPVSILWGNPWGMFCFMRHLVCLRQTGGQHSRVL